MTRPDIDAMDALVAKATEGPWTSRNRSVVGPSGPVAGSYKFRASDGYTSIATIDLEVPDAEFIAAAREYIPAINAYVRGLEAERDWFRDSFNAACRELLGPKPEVIKDDA